MSLGRVKGKRVLTANNVTVTRVSSRCHGGSSCSKEEDQDVKQYADAGGSEKDADKDAGSEWLICEDSGEGYEEGESHGGDFEKAEGYEEGESHEELWKKTLAEDKGTQIEVEGGPSCKG